MRGRGRGWIRANVSAASGRRLKRKEMEICQGQSDRLYRFREGCARGIRKKAEINYSFRSDGHHLRPLSFPSRFLCIAFALRFP